MKKKLRIKYVFMFSHIPLLRQFFIYYALKKSGMDMSLKSNRTLSGIVMDYMRNCYKLNHNKQKLVWVNFPSAVEVFYAFDVIPFMPETLGGFVAGLGFSNRSLDAAYSLGCSRDTCTFCNHTIGAEFFSQLPKPDAVISTMFTLCDAQGKSFEYVANMMGVPFHLISLPTAVKNKSSITFLAEELRTLVNVLEKMTNQKLQIEKLADVMRKSNEAIDAFMDFLELRKQPVPPIKGLDAFFNYFPMYNYCANIGLVKDYFTGLKSELEERIKKNKNSEDTGRIRLINAGHYFPLYDYTLLSDMEKENVTFTIEMFASVVWTKFKIPEKNTLDNLLYALAERYMEIPTVGSFEKRSELTGRIVREWNVDGAVNFLPWGCRVIGSQTSAVVDYLQKKINLPSLVLDCDPLDKSIYAKGSIQTRFHAFVEMLKNK